MLWLRVASQQLFDRAKALKISFKFGAIHTTLGSLHVSISGSYHDFKRDKYVMAVILNLLMLFGKAFPAIYVKL